MFRSIRVVTATLVLLATFDLPAPMSAAPGQADDRRQGQGAASERVPPNSIYIVRMTDLPVASYDGSLPRMSATKPGPGERVQRDNPAVVEYAAYLNAQHEQALRRAGGGRRIYDYRYAFNGFAADLTEAQANALRAAPGVLSVVRDEVQHADTSYTPTFLGLDAPDGLWSTLGGANRAGEGIVIGVIDSGIWPESESFADRRRDRRRAAAAPVAGTDALLEIDDESDAPLFFDEAFDFRGICQSGEQFPASSCNRKLIGARHFNAAWGGDAGLKASRPWEFASPRDYNGHGTHTAATAGGNRNVIATGPARVLGRVSGMAPRAHIAAYKALWSTQDGSLASGFTSDLVAAIDQAVADGVDVINYSITGTTSNFLDPAQIAFLFAADAGVFVAASAGNNGPATGTVAHPSPWITTVAASTHSRTGEGEVVLGGGASFQGASLAERVPRSPLIDAAAAGLSGADPTEASLCFSAADNGGQPVLDPYKVAGKIVVCDRGTTALVSKGLAVREAGGVGMILLNTSPNTLNAVLHYVPTVHLPDTARGAIKTYAAGPNPTATIRRATVRVDRPAPATAAFSSRGPLTAGGGDLLKPDVIAPGQDIVAAVAPPANGGLLFNMYSGTSMAAPHVAGVAALLKSLHRDWTPMTIKSALMTTGTDVIDGGVPAPNTNPVLIFRQGAGHITPNTAADPGLVYNSDITNWLAFLCGTTTALNPVLCAGLAGAGHSLDPSDLNLPSIAIGDLLGNQTVRRTVTNVGSTHATYAAVVSGMEGFTVDVEPEQLVIAPGQSLSFRVTFTRTTATPNVYTGGQLTWSDGVHSVRSPVVVRPLALAAPPQVASDGAAIAYNVSFGYTGPFSATPRGLIAATTTDGSVADDPTDTFSPTGPGVFAVPFTVVAGTTHARFSLFDANVTPPADMDLYVYRGTTLVGVSLGVTSNEEVNLVNPPPGNYTVFVHGFSVPGTASFTLFTWLLEDAAEDNMTVDAPTMATAGTSALVRLTFRNLTPGTKYLGSVAYAGTAGLPNPTIVRVDAR